MRIRINVTKKIRYGKALNMCIKLYDETGYLPKHYSYLWDERMYDETLYDEKKTDTCIIIIFVYVHSRCISSHSSRVTITNFLFHI